MPKKSLDTSGTLTIETIEKAVAAAMKPSQPQVILTDWTASGYQQARAHNKNRFINYCHPGTVLQHGTSGVKWTINKMEEVESIEDSWLVADGVTTYKELYIHMTSEKGYKKQVGINNFYMYDILEVPKAVEVLWGNPQENPPKSSKDFETEYDGIFRVKFQYKISQPIRFIPITLEIKDVEVST